MLHQTASLIIKAIPDMFHYLDHPQIPYTTNLLESFFGHLKEKLEIHRGLRPQAKRNFIKWYLHFKNNGKWVFQAIYEHSQKESRKKNFRPGINSVNHIAYKLRSRRACFLFWSTKPIYCFIQKLSPTIFDHITIFFIEPQKGVMVRPSNHVRKGLFTMH